MNNKPKILTAILAAALILAGCGQSSDSSSKAEAVSSETAAVSETDSSAAADPKDISEADESSVAEKQEPEKEAKEETAKDTSGYKGIDVASPDWISKLDAAKNADQLFVVAAFNENATDAWVSLHEKQSDGSWHMIMTTPGFIGKNGLGKTKEGDSKTPVGTYHFNRAFGIADDPGSVIPYVKVDNDSYWSGDPREGFHYNELVNLKDLPDLDTGECEHLIEYIYHYQYCLNISYNEEGTPGLGSAIFLHCFGPAKPFSGGCVAIPEDHMKFVMQKVDEKTAVVIDSYENLAGTDEWPDSTWPQVR
jgi:L,D-peptidoglycan transpeptidase YkuD (ErfK/YbiS/YcfS/YnhG family)